MTEARMKNLIIVNKIKASMQVLGLVTLNILSILCCSQSPVWFDQSPFGHQEGIRNATVTSPDGDVVFPMLYLQQSSPLWFQFDWITDDQEWLRYKIFHCDANGKVNDIDYTEFVQGFETQEISESPQFGLNTTTDYVHYHLPFPNDMMRPSISGRYWLLIYRNNDWQNQENHVVAFPFFVVEEKVLLATQTRRSSQGRTIQSHQQLDVTVNPNGQFFSDIYRDIHLQVFQNFEMQPSEACINPKPTFVEPHQWRFIDDVNPGFTGGNEWRMMSTVDISAPGFNIDHTLPNQEWPEVFVALDQPNSRTHSSWMDYNGKNIWVTKNSSVHAVECDYFLTHFQFKGSHESEQSLYLEIQTTLGIKELFPCSYDANSELYRCDALLKQGIYNYRYRYLGLNQPEDETSYTEGHFAMTGNDYHCFLYQRDPVYGLDRIIGFQKVSSQP
jgi:hypothetical protein